MILIYFSGLPKHWPIFGAFFIAKNIKNHYNYIKSIKMNKKILFVIFVVIGLTLVLCFFWHMENITTHGDKKGIISYFEIVKEDANCEVNCFLEYIVVSNGEIMEKFITDLNIKNKNGINMLVARNEDVNRLNEKVRSFFEHHGINNGIKCGNCSSYRLYYRDFEGKKSYAMVESDASDDLMDIMKSTQNVAENSNKSDADFFHFYYSKNDGSYLDYHIFSSGVVIRELFGKKSRDLKKSDIYVINKENTDSIAKLLTNGYFEENNPVQLCRNQEFLWGYLEIRTKNRYNYTYTCGDGDKDSDIIFNFLYKNFN